LSRNQTTVCFLSLIPSQRTEYSLNQSQMTAQSQSQSQTAPQPVRQPRATHMRPASSVFHGFLWSWFPTGCRPKVKRSVSPFFIVSHVYHYGVQAGIPKRRGQTKQCGRMTSRHLVPSTSRISFGAFVCRGHRFRIRNHQRTSEARQPARGETQKITTRTRGRNALPSLPNKRHVTTADTKSEARA
jgi:hypothetical protein